MKNNKAFTLIELIAVLVILALLALIVTPLVLNIIRKARIAADKRSIDAYGRSIELAIADYLLSKAKFPTSIEELTIEYSGDTVACTTTRLNTDSSVYLAQCTVGGRSVTGYTYGTDKTEQEEDVTYEAYSVGDEVTYNNVDYYVIKNSDETEASVTLLKAEPLTYEEVQTYSNGTGAEIQNNGDNIGGMQYHSNNSDYTMSYIKQVVTAWSLENVPSGLEVARLITIEELENLGYEYDEEYSIYPVSGFVPSWIYGLKYWYWTMSQWQDNLSCVWYIGYFGDLGHNDRVYLVNGAVRPVIVLFKSVLD